MFSTFESFLACVCVSRFFLRQRNSFEDIIVKIFTDFFQNLAFLQVFDLSSEFFSVGANESF